MTDSAPGRLSPQPRQRRTLRAVLISLLPLIILSRATAQTDRDDVDSAGLVIEASAGWDGTIDRLMPMPRLRLKPMLLLRLRNRRRRMTRRSRYTGRVTVATKECRERAGRTDDR